MENAADKVDSGESTQKRARKTADLETPSAKIQRKWAKQEMARKKKNPVIETFYELVAGRKLVLCKKTSNGSVHRILVGSTDDKDTGAGVKAKVEQLQKLGQLKVRV
jgi:cell division septation protein DedD